MRKIILISLLLVLLLTTGCELRRYICVIHEDVKIEPDESGGWVIPAGNIKLAFGISKNNNICDLVKRKNEGFIEDEEEKI